MSELCTMHATLVSLQGKGILLTGKSGSGKSEIALKYIENKNAKLVSDDVVVIEVRENQLWGRAPENIKGLMEIRGVGIVRFDAEAEAPINLVVNLKNNPEDIERMPKKRVENILGVEIEAIDLYAGDVTIVEKILVKLNGNLVVSE